MLPITTRIGSSSTAISNESDTQKTTPGAHPAQAEGMSPAQQRTVQNTDHPLIRGSRSKALVSDAQGKVVVVSNRTIDPKKPAAGGLAAALGGMMYNTDGLWFGWSGKIANEPDSKNISKKPFGRTTLAQVDLTQQQHDNYYAGYSNSVLWPMFHQKVKKANLENPAYFKDYQQVNKMFALQLARELKDDDVLWIHDYHLIPLAQELRALGCKQRMGFFNHIPLPPPDVIKQIPDHKQLMESLFSYDLVGMQTAKDVENLRRYVEMEGVGQRLDGALVEAFGQQTSVQDFPIGIDAASIDAESINALVPSDRSQAILDEVSGESGRRMLMIGVDRLDYTKGISKRLKAFREFLETYPEMLDKVTFVQIAAPTRGSVDEYKEVSEKTRELVNEINNKFGTKTWKPVMYFNESVDRAYLPAIYRLSRVGVVTPVADGMNLVAKEFVAAQTSENPGVLVLSEGAGVASQFPEAERVPSKKNRTHLVKAFKRSLTMPLQERQEKNDALMKNVKTESLSWWRENFLTQLSSVPPSSLAPPKDRSAMTKAYERSLTVPLDEPQKRRTALMSNLKAEKASRASRDRDDGVSSQAVPLEERVKLK